VLNYRQFTAFGTAGSLDGRNTDALLTILRA
jgi:hypothetical protein